MTVIKLNFKSISSVVGMLNGKCRKKFVWEKRTFNSTLYLFYLVYNRLDCRDILPLTNLLGTSTLSLFYLVYNSFNRLDGRDILPLTNLLGTSTLESDKVELQSS